MSSMFSLKYLFLSVFNCTLCVAMCIVNFFFFRNLSYDVFETSVRCHNLFVATILCAIYSLPFPIACFYVITDHRKYLFQYFKAYRLGKKTFLQLF